MQFEIGTIFKNTNTSYNSYFVYKRENGHYSDGLVIEDAKGVWESRHGTFKTEDLVSMPKMYPIVGKLNIDAVIAAAVLTVVEKDNQEKN